MSWRTAHRITNTANYSSELPLAQGIRFDVWATTYLATRLRRQPPA